METLEQYLYVITPAVLWVFVWTIWTHVKVNDQMDAFWPLWSTRTVKHETEQKTKSNPPGWSRAEPGKEGHGKEASLVHGSQQASFSASGTPGPHSSNPCLSFDLFPISSQSIHKSRPVRCQVLILSTDMTHCSAEEGPSLQRHILFFFYLLSVFPVQLVVWVISCLHVDLWPLSRVGKGTKFLPSWYWILHTSIPLFIAVQRWKHRLQSLSPLSFLYSSNLNFAKEDFLFIFTFHFILHACLFCTLKAS